MKTAPVRWLAVVIFTASIASTLFAQPYQPDLSDTEFDQLVSQMRTLRTKEWFKSLKSEILSHKDLPPEKIADIVRQKHPELSKPEHVQKLQELVQKMQSNPETAKMLLQQIAPQIKDLTKLPRAEDSSEPSTNTPSKEPPPASPIDPQPSQPAENPKPQVSPPPAPSEKVQKTPDSEAMKPEVEDIGISQEEMQLRPGLTSQERIKRHQQYQAAVRFWEKTFGPLNKTPAVRQLLSEMFTGQFPLDVNANEQFRSLLGGGPGNSDVFDDLLKTDKRNGKGQPQSGWNFGNWKWPEFAGYQGWNPAAPNEMSNPSLTGGRAISSESSWLSAVLFVVVLVGSLVLWRFWPTITGKTGRHPQPLAGLGAWPVDPRQITNREELIRAFEYLSVLVCGSGAKAWNHVTIAAALRKVNATASDAAEPLARLYALARYAPTGEPLPQDALTEARFQLCRLAGVSAT